MRPVVELLGLLTTALLAVATLLPLWRTSRWWVRALDFPRLQLVALGVVALALLGPSFILAGSPLSIGAATLALLCIGWHALRIFPYLPISPVQTPRAQRQDVESPRMRLVVANVLQSNRRADALLRIIQEADPDLVLAVETDAWWCERLEGGLRARWRRVVAAPLDNTYGLTLLARCAVEHAEVHFLVEEDVPSVMATIRLAPDVLVQFYGIHPRPPLPAQDTTERDAELVMVGRDARGCQRPVIVAGDLNDVAWSHTTRLFQRLSGLLDPRRGRGLFSTYHARLPFLRWPLDHIFHSVDFRLVELRRLPYFGSDHFAVLVELSYEPGEARPPEISAPDAEDRAEMREKIRTAGAASSGSSHSEL
jgi:endonuclease/exonuclease/phosphatase (EEP) superfamily protein YafD